MNWHHLDAEAVLQAAVVQSYQVPVLFFKHSTRCSISLMAKRAFEGSFQFTEEQVVPYFLDLLSFRPLSNQLATDLGVPHESPQLLLVKDGKCIYHASHSDIDAAALVKYL
jgi:bacillithiol system protein YtxJ